LRFAGEIVVGESMVVEEFWRGFFEVGSGEGFGLFVYPTDKTLMFEGQDSLNYGRFYRLYQVVFRFHIYL
jgi:hypothetical protein